MPKGTPTKAEIDFIIGKIYQKHSKWKAPKIRNEANRILQRSAPDTPPNFPSLSFVQKLLALIRKRAAEDDPQDKLWSLGSLDDYPISPNALPVVIDIRRLYASDMTIRQAKWVARLLPLCDDNIALLDMAAEYATNEMFFATEDGTFDSKGMDYLYFYPQLTDEDIEESEKEIAEQEGK